MRRAILFFAAFLLAFGLVGCAEEAAKIGGFDASGLDAGPDPGDAQGSGRDFSVFPDEGTSMMPCGNGVLEGSLGEECESSIPHQVDCPEGTSGFVLCVECQFSFTHCSAPAPGRDAGVERLDASPNPNDMGVEMDAAPAVDAMAPDLDAAPMPCEPSCEGAECGNDGCNGSCGPCVQAAPFCSSEQLCEPVCEPDCDGRECGGDGCGGECGRCPAAAPFCNQGLCGENCIPNCDRLNRECGDDGCGGVCGDCPGAAPDCLNGRCSVACVPNCEGSECGSDGCGGSCGECPEAAPFCNAGTCGEVCEPDCEGRECGNDGCEGVCGGACPNAAPFCVEGECQAACEPFCPIGAECGDDGCGGVCGRPECPIAAPHCVDYQCLAEEPDAEVDAAPQGEADAEVDAAPQGEADAEVDAAPQGEADAEVDAAPQGEADAEVDAAPQGEADAEVDAAPQGEADAEVDAAPQGEADAEVDAAPQGEADAEVDAAPQGEADAEVNVDAGPEADASPPPCNGVCLPGEQCDEALNECFTPCERANQCGDLSLCDAERGRCIPVDLVTGGNPAGLLVHSFAWVFGGESVYFGARADNAGTWEVALEPTDLGLASWNYGTNLTCPGPSRCRYVLGGADILSPPAIPNWDSPRWQEAAPGSSHNVSAQGIRWFIAVVYRAEPPPDLPRCFPGGNCQ